jgi:hypothetical protein
MNAAEIARFLLYTALVNYAVLIVWFLAFMAARDWLYRVHTNWFKLSPDEFDAIHYGGMAVYKLGILLFNVAPLVGLYLSRGQEL